MTPHDQRVSLARWCGWQDVCDRPPAAKPGYEDDPGPRFGPSRLMGLWDGDLHEVPDYLHDLNAVHDAERRLSKEQSGHYVIRLTGVVTGYAILDFVQASICATAAQRTEALLRTLELWTEDPAPEPSTPEPAP